ncbi:CLUMA_CG011081, isoform A [Clunio marinus]|uniref:CLUMA_CG011081, isoform A n=1 Tax=Clunio marinus TaxID=568069 RepID=A0A1J1IBP8_9DIPT|nr:CLUMA_CG011081, isoform A [Clunio marinus]
MPNRTQKGISQQLSYCLRKSKLAVGHSNIVIREFKLSLLKTIRENLCLEWNLKVENSFHG